MAEVIIGGVVYEHEEHYDRLELPNHENGSYTTPAIACPRCHNREFRIGYGNWECIAYCSCGHSMAVYDG